MIDLIIKLLFAGAVFALDYALDGKLDCPFRRLKPEELRMLRWIKKVHQTLKKKRRNV